MGYRSPGSIRTGERNRKHRPEYAFKMRQAITLQVILAARGVNHFYDDILVGPTNTSFLVRYRSPAAPRSANARIAWAEGLKAYLPAANIIGHNYEPHVGHWTLQFDMHPEEVAKLAAAYGITDMELSEEMTWKELDQFLEEYKQGLSEDVPLGPAQAEDEDESDLANNKDREEDAYNT